MDGKLNVIRYRPLASKLNGMDPFIPCGLCGQMMRTDTVLWYDRDLKEFVHKECADALAVAEIYLRVVTGLSAPTK